MGWLTEADQPAVRYLALRDLIGAGGSELRQARQSVPTRGWVEQLLRKRLPGGFWVDREDFHKPMYVSNYWIMLALSDLGVTKEFPWLAESAELWRDDYARRDGGFDTPDYPDREESEQCLTGNTARALVNLGYADDARVERAFGWMVEHQRPNGGWNCDQGDGVIDGWECMSAFGVYPRQKWTRAMKDSVERGLEFYLERRLLHEGARYDPWRRLHFPYHYFYDVLVGLEFVTALGAGDDPRAAEAVRLLKRKRLGDGRWLMDAIQPDFRNRGKVPRRLQAFVRIGVKPLVFEPAGQPSKMITLRALRVLKRLGEPMPD
jgi:hypothetical protein